MMCYFNISKIHCAFPGTYNHGFAQSQVPVVQFSPVIGKTKGRLKQMPFGGLRRDQATWQRTDQLQLMHLRAL